MPNCREGKRGRHITRRKRGDPNSEISRPISLCLSKTSDLRVISIHITTLNSLQRLTLLAKGLALVTSLFFLFFFSLFLPVFCSIARIHLDYSIRLPDKVKRPTNNHRQTPKRPRRRKERNKRFPLLASERPVLLRLITIRKHGRHTRQWARHELIEECWSGIHRSGHGSDKTHRLVFVQYFQLRL